MFAKQAVPGVSKYYCHRKRANGFLNRVPFVLRFFQVSRNLLVLRNGRFPASWLRRHLRARAVFDEGEEAG